MIVASFWVHRPDEFPNAANYPAMLSILQTSCDRLGLKHVVLTDRATLQGKLWPAGVQGWSLKLPQPLMKAVTRAQADWLYTDMGRTTRTLFVGADCIMLAPPPDNLHPAHVAVTYRHAAARYPINTGAIYVMRPHKRVRGLFNRIAETCGGTWCDDQRAIRAALDPMPPQCGRFQRAGLEVDFMPMFPFNHLPRDLDDPARGAIMVHFRGKARKDFLFAWAKRHGFSS